MRPINALPPSHPRGVFLLFWLLGSLVAAFIALPLLALVAGQSGANLARVAGMLEVRQAIILSIETAFSTTAIAACLGVPLAYALARSDFPGKSAVAALVDLPLAVPHTVAGIALLVVLGREGIIGAPAQSLLGLSFWSTVAGVVAAMLFVSVTYTVNAARIGFEAVDPQLEKVARTLGLGPWRTLLAVTLPLSWRGIMTGLTLTFARSISEFGAVVILAYYPKTAPVQIYEMFLNYGLEDSMAAAALLLLVTLTLFVLLRALAFGRERREGNR